MKWEKINMLLAIETSNSVHWQCIEEHKIYCDVLGKICI